MIIRFFDLETTDFIKPGVFPQIVQYAFVTWQDGRLVDVQHRYIMPSVPVTESAAEANGFTVEHWQMKGATPLNAADVSLFHQLMNRQVVGGHNVIAFDLPILAAECNRLGFAAPEHDYHVIETMTYALALKALSVTKSARLKDVSEALGLKEKLPVWSYPWGQRAHDAIFDAACAAQLHSEMITRIADGFRSMPQ